MGDTEMRYRRLGKTGLEVSVIGFGASPLGDVFSTTDPAAGILAVHRAIDRGINFFDVSPYYGSTLAEHRLGEALRGRRQEVVLATKCGRYGVADFDFSAERVIESVDASLARLQTDFIDLLQVHDLEFGSFDQIVDETIPAFRRLQQLGKVRYIGVTGYPLHALVQLIETASVDTVLSYCRYNLLVRDMDTTLTPVAKAKSLGLINASPLHMGVLSPRAVPAWHPAPARVRLAAMRAEAVCRAHGKQLQEVALRYCLAHPYVASTLVGMSTVGEVEQNLLALEPSDDAALIAEMTQAIGPDLNYVWSSGLPVNQS